MPKMVRLTIALTTLAVAVLALPALAQDAPRSNAMFSQIPLSLPLLEPEPTNGEPCGGEAADAAQAAVIPLSAAGRAEPIVVLPLTAAAGGIVRATEHEQRAYACEQEGTR